MSFLLQVCSRFLAQIMLLVSILVLLRGHNFPGGGFIGGLIAACAVALMILAFSWKPKKLRRTAPILIVVGLLFLLVSAALSLFYGQVILVAHWWSFMLFGEVFKVGTPLMFDIGIYLLILGSVTWLVIQLEGNNE